MITAPWVSLASINATDAPVYGRKAAMLGALLNNGFTVPDGYALPASRFATFLAANGIHYCPGDYPAYAAEIRQALIEASLEDDVLAGLDTCVDALRHRSPDAGLIVRSSALCEDSPQTSMAGAFASFPRLRGLVEVADAVRRCYASVFSDRVIDSFASGSISASDLAAAVIVQQFVPGDRSGVTFTADVTRMNAGVMTVSAALGSCEALTAGTAKATTYCWDKQRRRVTSCHGNEDALPACTGGRRPRNGILPTSSGNGSSRSAARSGRRISSTWSTHRR